MSKVTVLSYAGCSTCKKALAWLKSNGVAASIRPIVDEPPTVAELRVWIARSGKPIRKWFNTSGLSYRALDKDEVAAASDAQIMKWLAADGKLVKRPVLVTPDRVLIGFSEDEWREALG